jgi:hydroxylaminobenzene mutase
MELKQKVQAAGAALFGIGMFTGLWSAAALTGMVKVDIPHLALAAHMNALFGGLWLIALAMTFKSLHYGDVGRRRLAILTIIPAYGNWAVTLVASFLGVRGLEYTHDLANNVIAGLLQAVVVLPALVAVSAWVWGFRDIKRAS